MDLDVDCLGIDGVVDFCYGKIEEVSSWNGYDVQKASHIRNNFSTIVEEKIVLPNAIKSTGPLKRFPGEGKVDVEAGYSQKEGAYGKITLSWELGKKSDNNDSKQDTDRTEKDPGEVNSTDKDSDSRE